MNLYLTPGGLLWLNVVCRGAAHPSASKAGCLIPTAYFAVRVGTGHLAAGSRGIHEKMPARPFSFPGRRAALCFQLLPAAPRRHKGRLSHARQVSGPRRRSGRRQRCPAVGHRSGRRARGGHPVRALRPVPHHANHLRVASSAHHRLRRHAARLRPRRQYPWLPAGPRLYVSVCRRQAAPAASH